MQTNVEVRYDDIRNATMFLRSSSDGHHTRNKTHITLSKDVTMICCTIKPTKTSDRHSTDVNTIICI